MKTGRKMKRFKKDKTRLFDIIKSIEEAQATIGRFKFEDFIKGAGAREEIAHRLRGIGRYASQLSEEFKFVNASNNWTFLLNLQFITYNANDKGIDPYTLWYIVENDLPIIKDTLFEITAVMEDKGNDAFYV
jgi:uncharacterized protein with HEPN domain